MNKQIIFLGLILMCINLNGQKRDSGTIELAPNIGYSISFINGDETDDLSTRSAIQFGVNGDYFFNDRWSLRSGLSYSSMGVSFPTFELQFDYLNIPLNANWHFGKTRKWNLNFGITPGFLLKAKIGGGDVLEFYKSFQLAASYGIGYKIEVSDNFSVLIDGQNLLGITNIHEESNGLTRLNAGSSINLGGVFIF